MKTDYRNPARGATNRVRAFRVLGGLAIGAVLTQVLGCGVTNKVAVSTMVPLLESTVESTFRERDVETVREGIPANLLLLRGFAEEYDGDETLRILAAQSYFSFALGFVEDYEPDRAELLYSEGWRLGRELLERRDWFREAQAEKPVPSRETLEKIEEKDVPLLFWTLANWTRWVSLNLNDPAAVAQLARVELYLGRVIELQPEYYYGLPLAMVASLQSFRPEMLGGKPEASKSNFEEAFRVSGNRMLYFKVLYAEFYCKRVFDEECFVETLQEVIAAPDDLLPELQLWNEVAKDKAAYLLETRDDYF
ncbi:MAG: TRAP transporter TatT component family protein [Candidatus Eisenbacteria bacterium]